MTKLKLIAVAVLLLAMAGCSKETINSKTEEMGNKTVSVNIAAVSTKSIETPIATSTKTTIKDGAIFFFTSAGVRVHTTVLPNNAEGTIVIANVPTSATKLLMIANYNASTGETYADFDNSSLEQCQNLTISVASLQSNGLGVENVIMSGAPALITDAADSKVEAPKGEASITITPIVSRIEIKAIGNKTGVENQITGFRLLGVFIPNHYAQGTIAANAIGDLVKPDVANFGGKFPFAIDAAETGYLNDFNADGLTKDAAKAFAYHTIPANGVNNLPSIVVMVDKVTYNNGIQNNASFDEGRVQYVTVSTYKNNSGAEVTNFDAAKIYSISALNFGIDNLTNDPYSKPKSVSVTVSITAWEVVEITPDL